MKVNIFCCKKTIVFRTVLLFVFIISLGVSTNIIIGQPSDWKAPVSADSYKNPYNGNEKAAIAGKKLYTQYCAICHGNKGKGHGVAGMALKPRPADFTKEVIQKQTDGAIYWKMTEGKAPMAAYKETLTKEQRWQLTTFIRSLGK